MERSRNQPRSPTRTTSKLPALVLPRDGAFVLDLDVARRAAAARDRSGRARDHRQVAHITSLALVTFLANVLHYRAAATGRGSTPLGNKGSEQ